MFNIKTIGDDCLAMFPSYFTNTGCTFRFNTVGLPMQANAIAVYGGINSTVTDNIVYDVVVEGGAFQVCCMEREGKQRRGEGAKV